MPARYPSLVEALQSALAIKQVLESRRMGQNVPVLVADLWTVQGFASWYTFGQPREPIGAAAFGIPAVGVSDDEFLWALNNFIEKASPSNGDIQVFGSCACSVNWRVILIWCARAALLWLAQETLLGAPSIPGVAGSPAPPTAEGATP